MLYLHEYNMDDNFNSKLIIKINLYYIKIKNMCVKFSFPKLLSIGVTICPINNFFKEFGFNSIIELA